MKILFRATSGRQALVTLTASADEKRISCDVAWQGTSSHADRAEVDAFMARELETAISSRVIEDDNKRREFQAKFLTGETAEQK